MDIREIILNNEYNTSELKKGIFSTFPLNFPEAYKQAAINAMDENGKRLCLELLEYMAKNNVDCCFNMYNESCRFLYNGKWITAEQLFENFL